MLTLCGQCYRDCLPQRANVDVLGDFVVPRCGRAGAAAQFRHRDRSDR
ncbi:hypothetical protein BN2537_2493 [Streptomyces venezuelae]|nr:hypothetical protein BN2537_2493 [Streptomyces venezuelae]